MGWGTQQKKPMPKAEDFDSIVFRGHLFHTAWEPKKIVNNYTLINWALFLSVDKNILQTDIMHHLWSTSRKKCQFCYGSLETGHQPVYQLYPIKLCLYSCSSSCHGYFWNALLLSNERRVHNASHAFPIINITNATRCILGGTSMWWSSAQGYYQTHYFPTIGSVAIIIYMVYHLHKPSGTYG